MNNILITSAGRRVSLVNYFKKEVQQLFPQAKVFTTDINPEYSSACQVSDHYFKVSRVSEPDYIEELLNIAQENQVKLIIPTIDTELLVLANNKSLFQAKGIQILVSDASLIKIFRNKRDTHSFFNSYQIHTAKEFLKTNYTLPVYIKPIDGSRSLDNYIIKKTEDFTNYHFQNEKLMFLEYLDHQVYEEFTIDMYYNKNSELKCLVPRKRIEVRDGEVNKAITKEAFFIADIKQKLEKVEGFYGCITMQVFADVTKKTYFGIEINPRFGGGYPLSYLANANFVKWILQEYMQDIVVEDWFDNWEKNLTMLRYDSEVIVRNLQ